LVCKYDGTGKYARKGLSSFFLRCCMFRESGLECGARGLGAAGAAWTPVIL